VVINLVSSTPGIDSSGKFTVCNPATAGTTAALSTTGGMLAWGATLEPSATPGTFKPVPVSFLNATMSGAGTPILSQDYAGLPVLAQPVDTQVQPLASACGFIQSNGSGYGICKSCRTGALAGKK
jgi:hypothetical protein